MYLKVKFVYVAICLMPTFSIYSVVVNIQFASASFNGSESSGVILVTIAVTGAVSTNEINVMMSLIEGTAKG